ncbi:MAG: hypothetical protein NTV63_05620 [Candidatus Woesearchaeota archaeon]|nr:hypothetical protein [Candidatus Woesearchaeota archaeon]
MAEKRLKGKLKKRFNSEEFSENAIGIKLKEWQTLLYAFIGFLIIIGCFYLIRAVKYESIIPGSAPYYHARIAESILSGNAEKNDMSSFGMAPIVFNPYDYVLAFFGRFIGIKNASIIFPPICAAAAILFFYLILKKSGIPIFRRWLILVSLIATPAFLYSGTFSNSQIMGIMLLLSAFYFFTSDRESYFIISLFLFLAAGLFGFLNFITAIIMSTIYTYNNPEKRSRLIVLLTVMLCISPIYQITLFRYGLPKAPLESGVSRLISELGPINGISIFQIMLGTIGFFVMWKNRASLYLSYFLSLLFITAFLLNSDSVLPLAFSAAIFSGSAISFIMNRRWNLKIVRDTTIVLVFCGLLFSTVLFIMRASTAGPDASIIKSLEWLSEKERAGSTVFSHYTNGFWIEYFRGKAVSDENFAYAENRSERLNDSNSIFYSRSLEKTRALLSKYDTGYILITPDMKNGLVWEKKEEGLLFLLRNNESFRLAHSEEGSEGRVEIWRYLG